MEYGQNARRLEFFSPSGKSVAFASYTEFIHFQSRDPSLSPFQIRSALSSISGFLCLGTIDSSVNSWLGGRGGGRGSVLCSVGYLAAPLTSIPWMPEVLLPIIVITENISRQGQISPRKQNCLGWEPLVYSHLRKQAQSPTPICLKDCSLALVCAVGPAHPRCPRSWPNDHSCLSLTTSLFSSMYVGLWPGELWLSSGHSPGEVLPWESFALLTLFG